ncbi:pyruvoyl-dependent arginine decarboxylase [Patescibacteria group bacterium]|nr:pyruvoyl-dependent arginine decarboxylase [Patescibacteria group bacterium]MBU2579518.1 pyruvoyl-dependent arginine decarboxylase [Patescibacteria group bacterium]
MKKIKIFLTQGSGEGATEEGAYCKALEKAGMINLNLICLSSVLPHNSKIINKKPNYSYNDYGKKVYVILSQSRTLNKGETICAGLGWIKEEGNSGNGIVVEIQGNSKKKVEKDIKNSLSEIMKYRKEKFKKEINIATEEIICKDKPVCALVIMAFGKAHGWV